MLTSAEAAEILGIDRQTLYRWRHAGKGPPHRTRGLHVIVYELEVLLKWCDENNVAYSLPESSFPIPTSSEG